jgi:TonB family protein
MFQALLLIAAVTAAASAQDQSVQSKNGEFIFSQYPPRAKAAGEQGSVRFKAEVDARGNVMSCKVTEGSGYHRLDRETCDLIIDHARFKPALDGQGKAREAVHDGVINWRLPGDVQAPKPRVASAELPDKIICKRSIRTGSLVAGSRLCMTAREWIQSADNVTADWTFRHGHSLCGEPPYPAC